MSAQKSKTPLAFPAPFRTVWEEENDLTTPRGMTLRDYFAARAMQAFLQRDTFESFPETADFAYEMADEMLKERGKDK